MMKIGIFMDILSIKSRNFESICFKRMARCFLVKLYKEIGLAILLKQIDSKFLDFLNILNTFKDLSFLAPKMLIFGLFSDFGGRFDPLRKMIKIRNQVHFEANFFLFQMAPVPSLYDYPKKSYDPIHGFE